MDLHAGASAALFFADAMDTAYSFAGVVFEPVSGVLTVDGRDVHLRPRTASVLRCLLDRGGQVVGKEFLLKEVWADLVVTENSLAQCVKEIRRELGDSSEALLRTAHRRGYVLEVPVERTASAPVAINRGRSIIVMPIVNLGGDPDEEYFAEFLTEDLTNELGRMPGLIVIARGTAQAYAQRPVDAREVGHDLGVAYILEGSVRRAHGRVAVTLGISDTRDARQLWSERFEGMRAELGVLQKSMAARVTQWLRRDALAAENGKEAIAGPDARDLAMRAWSLQYHASPGVSREARTLLLQALELDIGCAFAWALLAHSHVSDLATRHTDDWESSIALAEHAALRAVELDPNLERGILSLAHTRSFQGRFEESLELLERLMTLNPNIAAAHQWVGIDHILMGNPRLAVRPLETCIELSPRDRRLSTLTRNLALAYLHMGEDERGLAIAESSVHQQPVWPRSYETLAAAYAVSGLIDDASATVAMLFRHWPGYTIAQHRAEMMSTRPAFLVQRERLLDGLRAAGLPER